MRVMHQQDRDRTGERAGQRAYNDLATTDPELAARIVGTEHDPFYDDARLAAFHRRVAELRQHRAERAQ